MRKGRPKYPQPRDVVPVLRALEARISMDVPLVHGMRMSVSNVPNFRIQGFTDEIPWLVDVYRGGFYYVSVKNRSERFSELPQLINYLRSQLK